LYKNFSIENFKKITKYFALFPNKKRYFSQKNQFIFQQVINQQVKNAYFFAL